MLHGVWESFCNETLALLELVVVVVILFPTEYDQWRTKQMSNITTSINIDDPVGGHQRSQRLIGLATKRKFYFWVSDGEQDLTG